MDWIKIDIDNLPSEKVIAIDNMKNIDIGFLSIVSEGHWKGKVECDNGDCGNSLIEIEYYIPLSKLPSLP